MVGDREGVRVKNLLHPTVCANGPYGHGARCRYHNGFLCEDCRTFVLDSDEHWYFTNEFGRRQERDVRYGKSSIPKSVGIHKI